MEHFVRIGSQPYRKTIEPFPIHRFQQVMCSPNRSIQSPPGCIFGKFRAAYAKVGSDSDVAPYSNALYYGVNGQQFIGQAVGNFGLTVPNAALRPMSVEETELGLELKMFKSRVNMDVAVYRKLTTDQIVNATISDASGFTATQINSGESENKGIEIMLNLIPVTTANFEWRLYIYGCLQQNESIKPADRHARFKYNGRVTRI